MQIETIKDTLAYALFLNLVAIAFVLAKVASGSDGQDMLSQFVRWQLVTIYNFLI